jgi:hypothetical protein
MVIYFWLVMAIVKARIEFENKRSLKMLRREMTVFHFKGLKQQLILCVQDTQWIHLIYRHIA